MAAKYWDQDRLSQSAISACESLERPTPEPGAAGAEPPTASAEPPRRAVRRAHGGSECGAYGAVHRRQPAVLYQFCSINRGKKWIFQIF